MVAISVGGLKNPNPYQILNFYPKNRFYKKVKMKIFWWDDFSRDNFCFIYYSVAIQSWVRTIINLSIHNIEIKIIWIIVWVRRRGKSQTLRVNWCRKKTAYVVIITPSNKKVL